MRGFVGTTVWFCALMLSDCVVASAAADGPQPYELVRSLQAVQDQVIVGNTAASESRPKLMAAIADGFSAAPLEAWHNPKNVRATIIYLLSGGQPKVVESLQERGAFLPEYQKLVSGALAFDEGKSSEADGLLRDVDARALSPGIGGYVAFAQSNLAQSQDHRKAMRCLDIARLLAPGTLVEEAALRREIALADEMEDGQRFVFLSRQYAQRFPKSLYGSNFHQQLVKAIVHLDLSAVPGRDAGLGEVLRELTTDDQRTVSLMVARSSVIEGKVLTARFAVDVADHASVAGGAEAARSKLYGAAALILSDRFDNGLERLKGVNKAQLVGSDVGLYDAVSAFAQQIGRWSDQESPGDEANSVKGDKAAPDAAPVISLAEQALSDADRLLKGQSP